MGQEWHSYEDYEMTNGKNETEDSQQKSGKALKAWAAILALAAMLIALTDLRLLALYIIVPAVPIFFFVAWLRDDKLDAANESDSSFLLISIATGVIGFLFLVNLTIELLSDENIILRTVAWGFVVSPIFLIFFLRRLSRKSTT